MDAEAQNSLQRGDSPRKELRFTLRGAPFTYLHLSITNIAEPTPRVPLDAITARTYLTSALSQYLGLTGTAIPIDILKVTGQHFWIRVPRDDASALVVAISQWANALVGISLKVEARGEWLGGVLAGGEMRREKLFSLEK